jgi:hypothetical protein
MGTGDRQKVMKPILVNARGAGAAAARSPLSAKVSRVAYPPQGLVDGGGAVADTKALVEPLCRTTTFTVTTARRVRKHT